MTKGCVKVNENVNVLHTNNHTHQREKSFTVSLITYTRQEKAQLILTNNHRMTKLLNVIS